eukprot:TRINITY_DN1855_c0_g1_i5.p1 TRINITY_DN1855_c0_g1~~TRINITY_DN1855_c0_g1_i5.p1  ORF type:complete len:225 (+),score=11.51 TRINITY_DN1855_c0_g1_i5:113-787(+)
MKALPCNNPRIKSKLKLLNVVSSGKPSTFRRFQTGGFIEIVRCDMLLMSQNSTAKLTSGSWCGGRKMVMERTLGTGKPIQVVSQPRQPSRSIVGCHSCDKVSPKLHRSDMAAYVQAPEYSYSGSGQYPAAQAPPPQYMGPQSGYYGPPAPAQPGYGYPAQPSGYYGPPPPAGPPGPYGAPAPYGGPQPGYYPPPQVLVVEERRSDGCCPCLAGLCCCLFCLFEG